MTEKKENSYNEYLAKFALSLRECSGNDKDTCDCSKCLFNDPLDTNLCLMDDILKKLERQNKEGDQ